MSSFSGITPIPKRSRLFSKTTHKTTPRVLPLMNLQWGKLLAEATEKDNKNAPNVNEEEWYDDAMDEEDDTTNKEETEDNDEMPLNLCQKSNTVPSLSSKLEESLEVLDLSGSKKTPNAKGSWQMKMSSSCTMPSYLKSNLFTPDQNQNEDLIKSGDNLKPDQNDGACNSKPNNSNDRKFIEVKNDIWNNNLRNETGFSKNVENHRNESLKTPSKQVDVYSNETVEVQHKIPAKVVPSNMERNSMESNQQKSADDNNRFAVPTVPVKIDSTKALGALVINGKSYHVLNPIGKGGSSRVYLVFSSEKELLAVKRVKLSGVDERVKNDYLNEIQHLLKMQHSKHVIKLYDHQYLKSQKILYVVMERGDTDLSRFLKDKATSDEGISPELIAYYWTEMLLAVKSIHDNNIIHRDLKPANFLLVSGRLKLIDFGIASSIQTEQTSILTDVQSGTFNYMSPEALRIPSSEDASGQKIGRKTDVWSLGCILYYFLYKKTPYQDLVNIHHKVSAITDPQYQIPFPKLPGTPDILIESCKKCLTHDVKKRASIDELLAFSREPVLLISKVLSKLKPVLNPVEYEKAAKALAEDKDVNPKVMQEVSLNILC